MFHKGIGQAWMRVPFHPRAPFSGFYGGPLGPVETDEAVDIWSISTPSLPAYSPRGGMRGSARPALGQFDIHHDPGHVVVPGLVVTASGVVIGLLGGYFKQDFVKTVGAVAAGVGVAVTIGRVVGKYWLAD